MSLVGLCRLWLPLFVALALSVAQAAQVQVRQVGNDVILEAHIELPIPVLVESVLRSGVPLTIVHEVDITQARWYWRDKQILNKREEWNIAYQVLTNQWRVENKRTGKVTYLDQVSEAWAAVTTIQGWPIATSDQLGAMDPAEVKLRWYVDRQRVNGNRVLSPVGQSIVNFEVQAVTSLRQVVAPVRDALEAPGGRAP